MDSIGRRRLSRNSPLHFSFSKYGTRRPANGAKRALTRSPIARSLVAMRHHAKAFRGIDQHDVVGHMRAGFRRRGAGDQRGGVDRPLPLARFSASSVAPQAAQKLRRKYCTLPASAHRIDSRIASTPRGPVRLAFRSSHALQEHADMGRQHAAVAMQAAQARRRGPGGCRRVPSSADGSRPDAPSRRRRRNGRSSIGRHGC